MAAKKKDSKLVAKMKTTYRQKLDRKSKDKKVKVKPGSSTDGQIQLQLYHTKMWKSFAQAKIKGNLAKHAFPKFASTGIYIEFNHCVCIFIVCFIRFYKIVLGFF
jgi:hypothetical protein